MKEPIIQSLFPTPVYKTDINRLFTNDELKELGMKELETNPIPTDSRGIYSNKSADTHANNGGKGKLNEDRWKSGASSGLSTELMEHLHHKE